MHILQTLNRERGVTIVMVTHDPEIAAYTQRVIRVRDGLLEREEWNSRPRMAMPRAAERTS